MLQQQCNGNLHLFVKSKTFCRELIESLKQNNELVEEYIYNRQIHVVVIRPDVNYLAFLEGEYTKIYTPQQLVKCFRPDSEALMVLKKDQRYFPKYYKFIKRQFGENISEDSVKEHSQYDLPPNLNQEILYE